MKIVNVTHGSFYALGAYAGASFTGAWFAGGYRQKLIYFLNPALIQSTLFAPSGGLTVSAG